jgi:deferrochelatase/peroxidase EfeB
MSTHADATGAGIDLDDIQGLLRFGFKHHTEAVFLLLQVTDAAAARRWLGQVQVTSSVSRDPLPKTVLQVALTSAGMRALGVGADVVGGFSEEFLEGMAGDPNRARRLGDVGANAPDGWDWGSGNREPHVAVLLYALPGNLEAFQRSIEAQCAAGFELMYRLPTTNMGGIEPFGFTDGLSQPELDWQRTIPAVDEEQLGYRSSSCLGEFILGYPNEYGLYTPRPLLAARRDPGGSLPRAEDSPDNVDVGRNGTYLVIRQLRQDVRGFWQAIDKCAGGVPAERERLASLMVGRTLTGEPVVLDAAGGAGPDNAFTFESDPEGHRCPIGAHIRRANPRNADLPPGGIGVVSQLIRTLGFNSSARARDLAASTRFHRLLRRGREYGVRLTPAEALSAAPESGLHFMCLNANIQRQFEFIQGAWLMSTKFNGLHEESDPLMGNRLPGAAGTRCDYFSMPQATGPTQRLEGLPQFVTVSGGAYFFLPGIRALRFMVGLGGAPVAPARREVNMDSNTARPVPPANTGSTFLNLLSDTTFRLLQWERRFDRLVRPAFDALLRDPLARLATALINWQRTNEGLALAQEKPLPAEEEFVDSIISTFERQMRGLWKPGGFERGGNTKTHGIVRAEFIVHENLPDRFRRGVFAKPQTYRAWVRFSGPGPYVTPDIDDVGFMSISIKLLGVPGPKLMDEEKFTQDFTGVSTPTFVTPDVRANAQLQVESLKNASIFYFVNLHRPHLLDFIMQGLWVKTQTSPFEAPYFSCVPYLLGEGQAMQYSVWPKSTRRTPVPRLPLRPPDNYLREAMVTALNGGDVELDFRIQLQTDPFRMPLENAAVLWPEKLSPRVSVATLRIARQKFDSPAQINFEKQLSYNPWHCIPEHRPLGNQSRARKRMYFALATLRHQMNAIPHYEPTGDEVFD